MPERRGGRHRLRRVVGLLTAVVLAAGVVGLTQASPERAEAAGAGPTTAASPDFQLVLYPLPQPVRMARTSRSTDRGSLAARPAAGRPAVAPVRVAGCDGRVVRGRYRNGRIPLARLCRLPFAPGHRLRADAAVALAGLNAAYRTALGHRLCLTDSYRSYASQVSVAARKPGLAARPGTSEHGWGLAADLCGGAEAPGTRQNRWLRANAPRFGWDNPAWARPDGRRPEPWHWEYVAGR